MPVTRQRPDDQYFNAAAVLPYELRLEDFKIAMQDIYDLLYDLNLMLVDRGLERMDEMMRPAGFSGMLSDALTASVAKHSRTLNSNNFHNGHPDLIPKGKYPNNRIASGDEGVEIKATRGSGAVDAHGAREAWLCIFKYEIDDETQPTIDRKPMRFTEITLARLSKNDFRYNARGPLGTPTASPNKQGLARLRANRVYYEPPPSRPRRTKTG